MWEPASRTGLRHAFAGSAGFTRPTAIPHSRDAAGAHDGSQQGILGRKLATGPDGMIAVVNSGLAPGRGSRVWVMRGRVIPAGR